MVCPEFQPVVMINAVTLLSQWKKRKQYLDPQDKTALSVFKSQEVNLRKVLTPCRLAHLGDKNGHNLTYTVYKP